MLTALQKKKRLNFANQFQYLDVDDWDTILWSDECTFEVSFGPQCARCIRTKDAKNDSAIFRGVIKFPAKHMIWGCMSARGVGRLYHCTGTVNNIEYCK